MKNIDLNFYFSKFLKIQESNVLLHKPALESLRTQIRSSTSSMTSVPKPLKFLRKHFVGLKELHGKWDESENKVCIFLL